MSLRKIYNSILEEYLPTRWSIWLAGLTPTLAFASIFLPDFLQKIGIPPKGAYTLSLRIGLPLTILFVGTFVVLLLVIRYWNATKVEHSKNQDQAKINLKDFKIHPEGYYINPKYDFEICPRCLHREKPIVAPMTRASGPWQCAACGYKIDVKAACVSSESILPTKKGFGLTHRK